MTDQSDSPLSVYRFEPEDGLARVRKLHAAAEQAFGNATEAGVWAARYWPGFEAAKRHPADAAMASDEGLRAALAFLDEIAPGVTKRSAPDTGWVGRGRRKR